MQTNCIYCDDCIEFMKSMEDEYVDLTITSPPYDNLRDYDGVNWDFDIFKQVADNLYRVTKKGGVVVWVVGDKTKNGNKSLTSFRQAIYFQEIGFNVYDVIIYEKSGGSPPHVGRYVNAFEYMFILSKGKPKTIHLLQKPNKWAGTYSYGVKTQREKDGSLTPKHVIFVNEYGTRTNIWRYATGYGNTTRDRYAYEHPAMFPEKLAEDNILSWSNEGDIVFDPMCGSGTTCKMAMLNKRQFIGCEISPKYVEIANKRVSGGL